MDIHNYKRQYERQVESINECKKLSSKNKKLLLQFRDYLFSEGIGFSKVARYLWDGRKLVNILGKDLDEADKADMRKVVAEIEQSSLSAESKKGFKILLRKLYRFIRGIDEKGVYPEEVRWISIAMPKNSKKIPEELLTETEVKAIIQNCEGVRNKTLVSTLAESGCRISEIGNMRIKHVSFENQGARLTVNGKTGMRKILVVSSAPYLQHWINQHPRNNDPEAYLWYSQQTPFLSYTNMVYIIKEAAKKAGIKKRVHAHLFRHSRATQLASIMPEASMKQYFGWGQDSKMCAIYIHMNGEATDSAILKANGLRVEEKVTHLAMQPKKCPKCYTENEVTNKFCKMCSFILDEQLQKEIMLREYQQNETNKLMNLIIGDKDLKAMLMQKLQEVKA